MRHLIVIIMIALLPIRSWAGDMMAVSMSTQALRLATSVAVSSESSGAVEDCPGHSDARNAIPLAHGAEDVGSQTTSGDGHCKTCVTCQICHSAAHLSDFSIVQVAPEGRLQEAPFISTFLSATLADCVKPPIS
jgi:hypothetical protein